MKQQSFFHKWISLNESIQNSIAPFLLVLLGTSFLISDFIFHYFSFADFIFMFISAFLFVTGQYRISSRQVIWTAIPVLILLVNIILSIQYNETAQMNTLLTQAIKGLFYLFVMIGLYNYIRRNELEEKFLTINIWIAMIGIMIGLYITIALYSDGRLPYEGLWEFTRSHPTSYEYQGNPSIIRTRSFFSEPAHFGFYLNIILTAYLFNKQEFRKNWVYICLLMIGLLSTLSYSMIAIMFIVLIIYFGRVFLKKSLEWSNWFIIPISIFGGLVLFFWDFINVTLIQRTFNILSGQDSSAVNRLFESWQYVNLENIWLGNGIGQTPVITNNYAYILSDFGLIGFVPAVLLTLWLLKRNYQFAIIFIFLNFFRGGYLSPAFWILCLFTFIYGFKHSVKQYKGSLFSTN